MKRFGWILAAAGLLGLLLAGMIGYLVWHMGQNRYVSSELVEVSMEEGKEKSAGAGEPRGAEDDSGSERIDSLDTAAGEEGEGAAAGNQTPEREELEAEEPVRDIVSEASPLRFVFAGDVLLSDHVLKAYGEAGTIDGVVDDELRSVIDGSDVFMVNQEFPFSNRGEAAADKQYTFRLPPEKISLFHELGINIVTLANNHALDYGTDALLDTCQALDEAGIRRVGAGANLDEAKKPVIMELKGKKVGFLGASRVIPTGSWNATASGPGMLTTYDPSVLLKEIRAAREVCDLVIVYVHWGIERDERPQAYQRTLGQQYIDAGADIVIGSHPHVLQGVEYYKGKPIVYSLGNFIFGSSIPRTALLTVDWDGENVRLGMVPGVSSAGFTRAVTDDNEKERFYDYMTSISYGAVVDRNGYREQ
ncbi:MAG: CapA family protein [Clostridiaceae bacterium]|uniref:CapA family protein n=1 Tax=Clostridium porci TaxID=2605778 RepID=A0A7X2TDG8_9CLOT|nr:MULTISPECIES: CapA family protein [Clostridium]MCI6139543.1 CapA family protein [Clostridium sp.]MDY3232212.1 CapA family protein [Clostridiaceae bacterium]MSS37555.1 CapA family protein [Clostridium porci]